MLHGGPEDFLGHLSGDDFVMLTSPQRAAGFCSACIAEFDVLAPHLYTPQQNRDGFVAVQSGSERQIKAPFMHLRIAGVN